MSYKPVALSLHMINNKICYFVIMSYNPVALSSRTKDKKLC